MKKLLTLGILLAGIITGSAQTVIDNFNVGPYIVDYNGQGDVEYRLRDNINLYEFFDLVPDTIFVQPEPIKEIENTFAVELKMGAGIFSSKEYGLEGIWKKKIVKNWYFNCGLGFTLTDREFTDKTHYDYVEIGVPLQIEYCQLAKEKSSLYALIGITPGLFSKSKAPSDYKKAGFLLSPIMEVGGNIPAGKYLLRIGAYATYKINDNVYKQDMGRAFIGGKLGVIF